VSAAKWHRERVRSEDSIHRIAVHEGIYFADEARAESAHHATAATALDALAVPGVASLLGHLAISLSMQTDTGSRVGSKWMLSDEERASLSALAKIGRGE